MNIYIFSTSTICRNQVIVYTLSERGIYLKKKYFYQFGLHDWLYSNNQISYQVHEGQPEVIAKFQLIVQKIIITHIFYILACKSKLSFTKRFYPFVEFA